MLRYRFRLGAVAIVCSVSSLTGCVNTWDTLTSRKFRQDPFATMFRPEDPMTVLRTSPEGDERAKAMRRLKEPIADGKPESEQDEAIGFLSTAATSDPSPVVRVAAIEALGRFQDPRALEILTASYYQATGTAGNGKPAPVTEASIQRVLASGGRIPVTNFDRNSLLGPTGFPSDVISTIRCRAIASLSKNGNSTAVPVLMRIADGTDDSDPDRDTRLAAVRGLKTIRTEDSVAALAKVLSAEKGKDSALAGRAHEGLMDLTGRDLPADPEAWDSLVKSGTATVTAQPNLIQQAGHLMMGK